jgi:putative NADH-flavin reductase
MQKTNLNIGIFGGTQGVGKHCVSQALGQGHSVTVLARDEAKIADLKGKGKLRVVKGDVLNQDNVNEVVKGQDVVINALGSRVLKGAGIDICSVGTKNIIASMKNLGVRRIITCTSLGVGDSYPTCSLFTKFFFWAIIKRAIADKDIQERYLFESGLDNIIVRPGGLTDNPARGLFKTQNVTGGRIPRADVATFMLKQLQSDEFLGKAVSLVSE